MSHVVQTCGPIRNPYITFAYIDAILIDVPPTWSWREVSVLTGRQLSSCSRR